MRKRNYWNQKRMQTEKTWWLVQIQVQLRYLKSNKAKHESAWKAWMLQPFKANQVFIKNPERVRAWERNRAWLNKTTIREERMWISTNCTRVQIRKATGSYSMISKSFLSCLQLLSLKMICCLKPGCISHRLQVTCLLPVIMLRSPFHWPLC